MSTHPSPTGITPRPTRAEDLAAARRRTQELPAPIAELVHTALADTRDTAARARLARTVASMPTLTRDGDIYTLLAPLFTRVASGRVTAASGASEAETLLRTRMCVFRNGDPKAGA